MTAEPLWIAEPDVVALMHLGEAIAALERGLAEEAAGRARNMEKTAQHWGKGSNMHAIGAICEGAGIFGAKTWGHTEHGSTPLLTLWDAANGRLLAVIEAFALGQMRTGAMSGVGTRWMAAPEADELAVIGTGKQAAAQAAAVIAVRPIRRVRVYGPTLEHRAAFAERLRQNHPGAAIVEAESAAAAVKDAAIVTLVTRARHPVVNAAMLARGAHVNAAGAITPERREFDEDLFARADLVAVDSLEAARRFSSEFLDWYGEALGEEWDGVARICDLVGKDARPRPCDLSIFKPMGMGISDLALGIEILSRARAAGAGRAIPHPQRIAPRMHA
jgi:ornithine cyclodeaminase